MVLVFYVVICVTSSFTINLIEKREQVVLLYLSSLCLVNDIVLWLFHMVQWTGLQCLIVRIGLTFCLMKVHFLKVRFKQDLTLRIEISDYAAKFCVWRNLSFLTCDPSPIS